MGQTFQTFDEDPGGDSVKTGLLYQRTRTDTLRSNFSGTSFPSDPVKGQACFRTDESTLYICTNDVGPVWTPIAAGNPLGVSVGGTGATTASGARTNLGLGTAAVANTGTGGSDVPTTTQADGRYLRISNNLSDLGNVATARSNLGLVIGTNVQAADATLTALAGLATGANKIPYSTGADTFSQLDFKDEDNMASNSATAVPSQQSVKAYVDANTGPSKFTSTDQTITSGNKLTIAHGLGAAPNLIQTYLVCQTGEVGFSAGEVVFWNNGISSGLGNSTGVSIWADATNIYVRYGSNTSAFAIIDDNSGAVNNLTNGNWKFRVMAAIL